VLSGVGPGRSRVIARTAWGRADTVDVFISGPLLLTSTRDGSADLYATDPATPGQSLAVVARGSSNEVMGAWSPDGSRIVFVSDRDGNYELYLADADGANAIRLTTTPDLAELSPEWTPDGRRIVYVEQPVGARAQIRIMNSDGTASQALTTDRQGANLDPAVSPDGRTIAFTSTRDGNYEVYLMAPDGSAQRPALVSSLKESKPAWFPNGDLGFIQERTDRTRIVPQLVRQSATAGTLPQVISPPDLLVTDFAVAGRGDAIVLEAVTASPDGRFDRRLLVLRPGAAPSELPRQPGEQQSAPALRLPLPR
jgi:Tol biopolymer transport system component